MKKIILFLALVLVHSSLFAQVQVTEARANSPYVSNCYPFGSGSGWTPYAGFIYKNIGAFQLKPGDKIKFDLGRQNETAIRRNIYFSRATYNGSTTSMQWVKVVSNTQTPDNPYGDNTIGDYELTYTAETNFNFPGGGFMIAIGNPVGSDSDCDQVLVAANSNDSSGKFVARFYRQSLSNNYNYGLQNTGSIGGFRIESTLPDNTAPNVQTRDITVSLDASGNASIAPQDVNNGTSDNSGNFSLSLDRSDFDCNDLLGNSLNFDGDNDNVRLSTPINIGQGNSTVEAWVKVPKIGEGGLADNERVGIILGNYDSPNNINYEIHARGQVRFYWNNGQANFLGTKDLRDGKWHHLAFVRIASENRFIAYIDGEEEFNGVRSSSQVTFSSTHRIGGDNRGNPPNFHGNIDELRIWNYARTQVEIESEMLDALKGTESGLLNYWNFEEGADSSLTDLAGGNTGTLNLMDPGNDWEDGAPNNVLIPVTLTATDASNNSDSEAAYVRVKDDLAPVINPSVINIALDAAGNAIISDADVQSMISDNCQITCVELSQTSFDCSQLGQNTVTLTVMDNSFNSNSASITVNVVDETKPEVVGKNIEVTLAASGTVSITPQQVTQSSSDNCGPVTLSLSQDVFGANDALNSPVTVQVTGTDPSGNATTIDVQVTVIDPVPEVITQDITVYLDANGEVTITPEQVDDGSNAVVGLSGLALDMTAFTCANMGENTVTLTATSTLGSSASGTATVTVVDSILPTVLTQNINADLNNGGVSITPALIDAGSFDNCEIESVTLDKTFFSCADLGLQTVTLTVTDVNGNSASATATVNVRDVTAPTVQTKNRTYGLDDNGQRTITAADVDNFSFDECGEAVTISIDKTSFDCNDLGDNVVTLTVTDASGNVNTGTAIVTIQDAAEPEVVVRDYLLVELDASGNASITPADLDLGSRDNCGLDRLEISQSNFTCADVGTLLVTTRAYDVNGNIDVNPGQTIVEVRDVTNPIVVTKNLTVSLDSSGVASITADQVNDGSTDGCGIASLSLSKTTFDCSNVGANTVMLTVTDVNGNFSPETATVTVVDSILPTVLTQNINADLNNGGVSITPALIDAGSFDNCEIQSITLDKTFFTCADLGLQTVTLTVTDVNGNSASATATVNVRDVTAPTVQTKNRTYGLDDNGQRTITAADVDNFSFDECGEAVTISIDKTSFDCSDLGDNVVTLTVTDASGNVNTGTAIVTIQDAAEPEVVVRDYLLVELDASGNASITPADLDLGSRDNCGLDRLEISRSNFTCADVGTLLVTTRAYDVNGNMDVNPGQTIVGIRDVTNPIVVTKNLTISLDSSGVASITADQVNDGSTDTCGIASLSLSKTTFDCSNVGANTVTLTVTDVNGNFSTETATVTVVDSILPTVLTQNITADLSNGGVSITPDLINAGSFDNCEIQSITLDKTFFTCADLGLQTVTLTVTDVNGNSASATATVNVRDVTAPTVQTKNRTYGLDDNGQRTITAADVDNFSFDECGEAVTISIDKTSFDCNDLGDNVVTLTVTDASGNVNTGTAIVTIQDAAEPEVVVRDYLLVELDASGNASITPADLDLGSRDNCSLDRLEISRSDFTCADVGTLLVTTRAYDVNGNMDVNPGQTIVEVRDVTNPVVITQDIIVQLDASGNATITPAQVDNGSSDACGIASLILSRTTFDCSNVGANAVTLTVTDNNGNQSSASAMVTVDDNIAPSVLVQDIEVALGSDGTASITASDIDAGSSDNCSFELSIDVSSFDCTTLRANTVTLTATDASGNSSSATATVTVIDNAAPVIVTKPITLQLDENGQTSITASQVDGGTTDNCGVASVTIDISSFDCEDLGNNTVTITATDVNGNSATATVNVEVIDIIPPTVSASDITVELDENGQAIIIPEDVLIFTEADIERDSECEVAATDDWAMKLGEDEYHHDDDGGWWKSRSGNDLNQHSKGKKKKADDDDDGGRGDHDNSGQYVFDTNGGTVLKRLDGSLHIIGTLINARKPSDSWTLSMELASGMDWESWSALGRDKRGNRKEVRYHYKNWSYHVVSGGTLTGNGRNAGKTYELSHAPHNIKHGFQLGAWANNETATEGLRGSFKATSGRKSIEGELNLEVSNCALLPVPDGTVFTADNCSITDFALDQDSFSCADIAGATVNLTATDQSGNATTVPVTVTVLDNIAPTAVVQNIEVSLGLDGTVTIDPEQLDGGSTDNTDCLSFSIDRDSFDCSDVGKGSDYYVYEESEGDHKGWGWWSQPKKVKKRGHKVTLTVTDAAGNTDQATAYVTIKDELGPEFSQEPVTIVVYDWQKEYLKYEDVYSRVSDNCMVRDFWYPWTKFDRGDVGMNQVAVKAWDYAGNKTYGSINVEVIDISHYGRYVEICYRGETKSVKKNQVQKYLRKGAKLGSCNTDIYAAMGGSNLTDAMGRETWNKPLINLGAYPNPTDGETTITFSSEVAGPASVGLISPNGIKLANLFEGEIEANQNVEVGYNTSELPNGMYIIRLVTAGESRTIKLMVKR